MNKSLQRLLTCLSFSTALSACSSFDVSEYESVEPELIPEAFFDGKLTAHGVVKNRSGGIIRTFNANIEAYWRDGIGTLEEDFIFDDGEKQRRVWTLTPNGDGSYTGTAGDVVGEGRMEVAGNSAFLDYVLRIPWKGDSIDIRVDDRMYLVQEKVLINESTMKKFGLQVGGLVLVIIRE